MSLSSFCMGSFFRFPPWMVYLGVCYNTAMSESGKRKSAILAGSIARGNFASAGHFQRQGIRHGHDPPASAAYGIRIPRRKRPHLDLLLEAWRLWKGRLANFRLQTLEEAFSNRRRVGDIPSEAIPDAYRRYVETGDASKLAGILHHNVLDLLTMAQLLCAMLSGSDVPSD